MAGEKTSDSQCLKIKDFCTVKRGGSPRPIESYLTTCKDGLNWLLIGDVDPDSEYIEKTRLKIIPDGLNKTTLVLPNELILSNSMSFGRPYISKIDTCIHDGWLALKNINKKAISTKYLYYLLSSSKIQNDFRRLAAGSGVKNLKRETVENITLCIPDTRKQSYIVEVLDCIKMAISLLEESRVDEMKVFDWMLKKHFNEKANNYPVVKIEDIANVERGKPLTSEQVVEGAIPVIAGGIDSPYCHNTSTHHDVITVSASGANAGYVAYRAGDIFASDCSVIYGKEGVSETLYIYFYLLSMQRHIYQLQSGGAQPHVHAADLAKLRIELPDLLTQNTLINQLSTQKELIACIERRINSFKSLYKYCLNHLMNGDFGLSGIQLEEKD